MKFTEAFTALGYTLSAPRQDWSAEKAGGICISLWREEMATKQGLPWIDTRMHAGDLADWRHKAGNKKRTRHIARALAEFDARVDVVIVHGKPGGPFRDADPWKPLTRGGEWYVTAFDAETGHFSAEVRRSAT